MKYIIDRFEGDYAVCENDAKEFIEIVKTSLPNGAREGSVIFINDNGKVTLLEDEQRSKRISEKMKKVWK